MSITTTITNRRQSWHRTLGLGISAAGAACLAILGGAGGASAVSAAGSSGALYGDPSWAAQFWAMQSGADTCAELASADVIAQVTGQRLTEPQIVPVAEGLGVYHGTIDGIPIQQGSSLQALPALLAHYGVSARYGAGQSIATLAQALSDHHAVIVGVDGPMIWSATNPDGLSFSTDYPNQGDNQPIQDHAVVVTGIDESAGTVYLNDSGAGGTIQVNGSPVDLGELGREEQVPLQTFEAAWNTGNSATTPSGATIILGQPDSMVVTDAQIQDGGANAAAFGISITLTLIGGGTVAAGVAVLSRRRRAVAPVAAPRWPATACASATLQPQCAIATTVPLGTWTALAPPPPPPPPAPLLPPPPALPPPPLQPPAGWAATIPQLCG